MVCCKTSCKNTPVLLSGLEKSAVHPSLSRPISIQSEGGVGGDSAVSPVQEQQAQEELSALLSRLSQSPSENLQGPAHSTT